MVQSVIKQLTAVWTLAKFAALSAMDLVISVQIVLVKVLDPPMTTPKERIKEKVRERKEKGLHVRVNLMKFLILPMMIGGGMNKVGDPTRMMGLLIKSKVGMIRLGKMNPGMKVGRTTLGNSKRLRFPVLSLIWMQIKPGKRNRKMKSL